MTQSSAPPSGLERPHGGASNKLRIKSDALKARNAGEYLAADAARAEETERAIAVRSPVCDTQRSDSPGRANEGLRRPFLRNASVIPGLEKAPEWTGRSGTRYCCVDGARDLEAIAAVRRLSAWLGPEVIVDVLLEILPDDAPRWHLAGNRLRYQRREACGVTVPEVAAEEHAALFRRDNGPELRAHDMLSFGSRRRAHRSRRVGCRGPMCNPDAVLPSRAPPIASGPVYHYICVE
jgi:hypothetical protein